MQHLYFSRFSRTAAAEVLLLATFCVCLLPVSGAHASALHQKLERAARYYEEAEQQRAELEQIPASQRTAKDYLKVIRTYRRVYLTAPTHSQNPKSFMAIGDLYRQASVNLNNRKYFGLAIQAYEFLLQEYPFSRFQAGALLAVAQIYQEDLKQPAEARKRVAAYLETHPKAGWAQRALAEMEAAATTPAAPPTTAPPVTAENASG